MMAESLALPTSRRGTGPTRLGSDVVALLLFGLAYFTFAYLGLRLASINPSATPVWPPTGFAIAAILLWGYRIAPAIFIGAFLINQLTAGSVFTSFAIAGGNTLEAVIAGYLVRRWAGGEQVFDTPIGVAKFALISLAASVVSATIGVSSLTVAGYAEVSSFLSVWLTWWLGDFRGAVVVAPVVVLWAKSEPASRAPPETAKPGLTCLAPATSGVLAFWPLCIRDALIILSAFAYFFTKQLDLFEYEAEQALALAPYDAELQAMLGALIANMGQWQRGVALVERANALNSDAAQGWYHSTMYLNDYFNGDYKSALEMIRKSPDFQSQVKYAYMDYIAICGQLGRKQDALEKPELRCSDDSEVAAPSADTAWQKVSKEDPGASAQTFEDWYRMWNFRDEDISKLMDGVYKSGVAKVQPVEAAQDHHTEAGAE